MGAGYLNKIATFKRRDTTQDDTGATRYDFSIISNDLTRVPVGYRPERGWERDKQDQQESATMGVMRVRSCQAAREVRTDDIIVLHHDDGARDETFVIKYADNRDRHDRFIQFSVEAGTAVM